MKRILVRYKTKPEDAPENERLIRDVFRELREKSPSSLRYLALKLADGTFVHFASVEDGAQPVSALDAFQSFQDDIEERCIELPHVAEATIVGDYRMLGE
jgi:hypothetical protein